MLILALHLHVLYARAAITLVDLLGHLKCFSDKFYFIILDRCREEKPKLKHEIEFDSCCKLHSKQKNPENLKFGLLRSLSFPKKPQNLGFFNQCFIPGHILEHVVPLCPVPLIYKLSFINYIILLSNERINDDDDNSQHTLTA